MTASPKVSRRRGERGVAAVMSGIFIAALLFPLCAVSVDVARWYVEIQKLQNAADAAATAGVTYLPDDFASARSRAVAVAAINGYSTSSKVTVDVTLGDKPTQLKVTITSAVDNAFAGAMGTRFSSVARTAVAEYLGPIPLGSPCNTFGNDPGGASSSDVRGPASSVVVTPQGGAVCSAKPQFWAAIAGPDTPKQLGDAYMTRICDNIETNCTNKVNTDFDPQGYFIAVRVGAAAVGSALKLQIFDPAFIAVGDSCGAPTVSTSPASNPYRDNENPYVTTDGTTRYANGSGSAFCSGDNLNGTTSQLVTTSYGLRQPTDSYDASQGTPMPQCERQYDGYTSDAATSNVLDGTANGQNGKPNTYNAEIAKVFRQWVKLCTFTPTQAGTYYLQVRTNVKRAGTSDGEGGWTNNSNVFSQTGDDTSVGGYGNNRFSLRVAGGAANSVSISGFNRFSLYANYAPSSSGTGTVFNLARVPQAAAGKVLDVGFFDVGDATNAAAGTVQVLPPAENGSTTFSACTQQGGPMPGALTDCKVTNVKKEDSKGALFNGQWVHVLVQIPASYTCNSDQSGGCWVRVNMSFPGGPVDTTTWSASLTGDPVRLTQ